MATKRMASSVLVLSMAIFALIVSPAGGIQLQGNDFFLNIPRVIPHCPPTSTSELARREPPLDKIPQGPPKSRENIDDDAFGSRKLVKPQFPPKPEIIRRGPPSDDVPQAPPRATEKNHEASGSRKLTKRQWPAKSELVPPKASYAQPATEKCN